MKKSTFLASLLVGTAFLTACGTGSAAEKAADIVTEVPENTVITFWHGMSGTQGETLEALTKKFEEAHPNIKVDLQNQGAYADLQSKLLTTMQSPKDLPTLTQAYPDWLMGAMEDELIVDLKPYIEHESIGYKDWDDVQQGLRDGVEFHGEIVAIPFNKSTEVLWYNKSIFDELKLEVPQTFEELAAVSKTIYEEKGIPGCGWDSLPNFYVTYLKNLGTEFSSQLDVKSADSEAAVNYYLEGVKEGYFRIAGTDNYMSGPFGDGNVAMYIGSNAGESYVVQGVDGKFDIGVAPYPAEYAMQQGTDLYVFTEASPEQRTAAFEYMTFLTQPESQKEWAIATGYMPVRTSVMNDESYENSGSLVAHVFANSRKLFTYPKEVGIGTAYNDVRPMMEGILTAPDKTDVKAELERFEQTFKSDFEN